MPSERENILNHIVSVLQLVPGVKFVSRDWGLVITGQTDDWPGLFVVDIGDKVDETETMRRHLQRTLQVAIVGTYRGVTRETAPREIGLFLRKAKKVLYQYLLESSNIVAFFETGMSHLSYASTGPKEVHQGIQFDIQYIESIQDLLNDVTCETSGWVPPENYTIWVPQPGSPNIVIKKVWFDYTSDAIDSVPIYANDWIKAVSIQVLEGFNGDNVSLTMSVDDAVLFGNDPFDFAIEGNHYEAIISEQFLADDEMTFLFNTGGSTQGRGIVFVQVIAGSP